MNIVIREQVPLNLHTTLKIGGVARYFIEVRTVDEVDEAAKFAKQTTLPHIILGSGSNLLITDEGFNGVVIHNLLKGRQYIEDENEKVIAIFQAGELLDDVIKETVERAYFGLENLSAIPGTVGATPVQNVGAYGVEVADCIETAEAYHVPTGKIKTLTPVDCKFGYRDSFFKTEEGKDYIITAVHFRLTKVYNPKIHYADLAKRFKDKKPTLKDIREAVIEVRSKKFPDWNTTGTAGSFFKNPVISKGEAEQLLKRYPKIPFYDMGNNQVKIPLGYILDNLCNLKGFKDGKVGLFEKQALVLVNYGGATSGEVLQFVKKIESEVFAVTGIVIVPEVRFVGL